MDKKVILLIGILISILIFPLGAEDTLKNPEAALAGNRLVFYIEAVYELDNSVYVSDELIVEPYYSIKVENRSLNIYYFPRGNTIQIANEATHYPPLVRLIEDGNKIAFRIDLNKIISKAGIFFDDIDGIEITIVDAVFDSEQKKNQSLLTRDELYTKKYLYSSAVKINKIDYEIYWKER